MQGHTHFCGTCGAMVAVCTEDCQHTGPQYCSIHHPDPQFKIEDKPTVRMTVKVAADD